MNELQLEIERHRKTWRQLEQVTGLLRDARSVVAVNDATSWTTALLERIDAALSLQAEPVEPAPAQDERETHGDMLHLLKQLWDEDECPSFPEVASFLNTYRPAQTEQQPLGFLNSAYVQLIEGTGKITLTLYADAGDAGDLPIYAAPIARTAPQPKIDYKRKFECLVEHAKRQDKVIAEMRYDENIRRYYDDGAVWFWAGDDSDNLETLACPVVINAGDLRALIGPQPEQSGLVEALRDLLDCPYVIEEATIPKAGIEAAPPYQVVGTLHVSLTRFRKARAALSAHLNATQQENSHD